MFVRIAAAALSMVMARPADGQDVESLAWLGGDWEQVTQSGPHVSSWTVERWSRPRGGVMLGTSLSGRRTVSSSATASPLDQAGAFEYMRIARSRDGRLTYFASPGGAPATAFPLARMGRYEAVFENAAHDYPQRITYRWDGNIVGETLTATISMIDGTRPMSWTYRRPQP